MGKVVFVLSLLSVVAVGCLVWFGVDYYREEFPNVAILKSRYPILRYEGPDEPPTVTFQKSVPLNWVILSEISKQAVGAIVVSEDWAFYQHKGFDSNQIKEAIIEDLQKGRFKRGASTITQQVVRNVFLTKDKNLWRKIKELYLSVKIEEVVGKRKILETYLNIAEWGEGIYGIRAASNYYFRKSPAELTAKEGAFLAMLLPSPKRYSQSFKTGELTDYARDTINDILDKMTQARYITDEEKSTAEKTPLSFELPARSAL